MSLNLNYKPESVVDISELSREEWLDYRRKGIGGSDAAAIMGVSPFATKRDLFYDKTGIRPVLQENEDNWVAKEDTGWKIWSQRYFLRRPDLRFFRYERCSDIHCIPGCLQMWTFLLSLQTEAMESWNVRQPITTARRNGPIIRFPSIMNTRFGIICPS